MWGFASNNCEMQLKHVVINETNGGRPWEQPWQTPVLLVWSSWLCGTGMGFYILWPHTAAFSKQSTIIRSDKRANTVHSRVKKRYAPLSLLSLHPYVALFSLTFSHFPLHLLLFHYFCSFLLSHQQHWLRLSHALNNASLSVPGMETAFCLHELISSDGKCVTWK